MTIPIKWLIGFLLLMFLGSFIASFMGGGDSTVNALIEATKEFGDSFENFSVKSIGDIFYAGGDWLFSLGGYLGSMVFWNFAFFNGFEWIQTLLCLVNVAIIIILLADLWRLVKPFGG